MKIARNQWNDDGRWFVANGDPLAHQVKEALTAHFNAENSATGVVVELLSPIKPAAKDTATFDAIVGIGKHGEVPTNLMIEGVLTFSTHLKEHPLIKDQVIVETTMMVHYNEDTSSQKVSEAITSRSMLSRATAVLICRQCGKRIRERSGIRRLPMPMIRSPSRARNVGLSSFNSICKSNF